MVKQEHRERNEMMQTKEKKKALSLSVICIIVMAVLFSQFGMMMPSAVRAAASGSITVNMKDGEDNAISGGSLSVYQVAAASQSGSGYLFSYTDAFRQADGFSELEQKVNLKDAGTLLNEDVVSAVAAFQEENKIQALKTQNIGETGTGRFTQLDAGVYLVRQTSHQKGVSGVIKPFLVTLPTQNEDGTYNYDVNASPKVGWIGLGDPSVTKIIKGREDKETSFEFKISPEQASSPMPEKDGKTVDTVLVYGEGTSEFGEIQFTSPGTYRYIVTETNEGKMGYTYDTSRYRITYEVGSVKGAASGSALTVKRTVTEINTGGTAIGQSKEGENVSFTNTYRKPAVAPGTGSPSVTKKIKGDKPASSSAFSFTLTRGALTSPMPEGSQNGKKTIRFRGTGSLGFGTIEFKSAGTYTYTVRETQGNEKGYQYDSSVYRIVYTVTEQASGISAENKSLHVTQSVYRGETGSQRVAQNSQNVSFHNTYTESTPQSPSAKPEGPSGTIKKTRETLPQTGQLWWPVWALAGAGGALVIAGSVRRKKS